MRILITGSRHWTDEARIRSYLRPFMDAGNEFVTGNCPTGVDFIAVEAMPLERTHMYAADWKQFGRSAGPRRNQVMVDAGADFCIAFFQRGRENRGTRDCAVRATKAGIPVFIVWS